MPEPIPDNNTATVVIPTQNAGRHIPGLLDSLQAQTLKPAQIIVVDSESTDQTVQLARSQNCKVITIKRSDFDHGTARNLPFSKIQTEFVIYLTQDALPCDKYAVENIIRPLSDDEKAGAAFGRQLPYPDASFFAEHLRLFNYPENSYERILNDKKKYGIKTAFLSNSFAAYRRSVLEEIGYFKSDLIFGEDTLAAAEILLKGYKIAYAADAKIFHSHNYTVLQDFKRYFDMGVFHKTENWLLNEFGSAKGQAFEYVKSEFRSLLKRKKFSLLPVFVLRNFMKHLGYNLGLQYNRLPIKIARQFSMNQQWWDKKNKP